MVSNFTTATVSQGAPGIVGAALHSQVTGAGEIDALLLHGLFGMGSNLGAVARALARGGFRTHQLDLPNHGRSPWLQPVSIEVLADAVDGYLAAKTQRPVVLLGHSLGGKVAMEIALRRPGDVAALVIADIAPLRYARSHDAVFTAIRAVTAGRPESRREAAELMRPHIREEGVIQFLLLSLQRDGEGIWRWRFNADGLWADYGALLAPPRGDRSYAGPVLLLHGATSSYVTEEGIQVARGLFSALQVGEIARAGHWLHAEQPQAFNGAVLAFLDGAGLPRPPGVAP